MKKYADLYYTIRLQKPHNKLKPDSYTWTIRDKEGESLEVSDELFNSEEEAEINCQEHIQHYYD